MQGIWVWNGLKVGWSKIVKSDNQSISVVLVHGFGASKEHWRYNQSELAKYCPCFAIDLIGFGNSSQPMASLNKEEADEQKFFYCFENWANQVNDFCKEFVNTKILLVGNSIGGVIALRTAQLLKERCYGIVLIDCAQRKLDDKRLSEQPFILKLLRPILKSFVRTKLISKTLFINAANPKVINQVLRQAYPSGQNINESLIKILLQPSKRKGASEAFRGFINLFDDYLAPQLLERINIPVYLIWGEKDPWEPIDEALKWTSLYSCIKSINVIPEAGHCPHDEMPEKVNPLLKKIIQEAT